MRFEDVLHGWHRGIKCLLFTLKHFFTLVNTHFGLHIHLKQLFVWFFVSALSFREAHSAITNQGFKCWRIKQLGSNFPSYILVQFIIHPLLAQHPKEKTALRTFVTNLKEKQQKAKCITTHWKHSNPATWGWCTAICTIFCSLEKRIKLMLQN